jgi:hypothetical protein
MKSFTIIEILITLTILLLLSMVIVGVFTNQKSILSSESQNIIAKIKHGQYLSKMEGRIVKFECYNDTYYLDKEEFKLVDGINFVDKIQLIFYPNGRCSYGKIELEDTKHHVYIETKPILERIEKSDIEIK